MSSIRSVWRNPIHFLAFGFGSGLMPVMPGTFGTVVGVVFYLLFSGLPLIAYLTTTLVFMVVGFWLCDVTARDLNVHDHPGIVWDEIVGFMVTMIALPVTWVWILSGFLVFRFFDVLKPWPISWIDKKFQNGYGIVLDDVLAGVYALAVLQIAHFFIK